MIPYRFEIEFIITRIACKIKPLASNLTDVAIPKRLVFIPKRAAGKMLRGHSGHCIIRRPMLLPPIQFDYIRDAAAAKPTAKPYGYDPLDVGVEFMQMSDCLAIQVVIVVMALQYKVNRWQIP